MKKFNFDDALQSLDVIGKEQKDISMEQQLWDNYEKNIEKLKARKSLEERLEKGEGDQDVLTNFLSATEVEIHLTPEEQWQTINDILATKNFVNEDLKLLQNRLKNQRQMSFNIKKESAKHRYGTELIARTLGTKLDFTGCEEFSLSSCCDYVERIVANGEVFDYDECLEMDAKAEALIGMMSTAEEKIEALRRTRLFDTTREKIQQDINLALIEEAKMQRATHVGKKEKRKSIKEKIAQLLKRDNRSR